MLDWWDRLWGKEEEKPEPSSVPLKALIYLSKLEKKRLQRKEEEENPPEPRRSRK